MDGRELEDRVWSPELVRDRLRLTHVSAAAAEAVTCQSSIILILSTSQLREISPAQFHEINEKYQKLSCESTKGERSTGRKKTRRKNYV